MLAQGRSVAVPILLFVIGAAMVALCWWARDLHRFTQWVAAYIWLFIGELAMCLLACGVVLKWNKGSSRRSRWLTFGIILVVAMALRFTLVPQRPFLSSDAYRYAWDGHVQANGINPYAGAPDATQLDSLRDSSRFPRVSKIYPEMNRTNLPTPYPPGAQLFFLLIGAIHPLSVIAFKAAAAVFDLISILTLMVVLSRARLDPARVILFAWHPLPIWEGAHSGHIEAAFMMLLSLALLAWSYRRNAFTGMLLALAAAVKYYPALVLPAFFRPGHGPSATDESGDPPNPITAIRGLFNKSNLVMLFAFVATAVLVYLPYVYSGSSGIGSLDNELKEEGFTGTGARYFALGLIHKLVPLPVNLYLVIGAGLLALLAAWWMLRAKPTVAEVARGAATIIGIYWLLTSPRYAWYYAWILPFLCFEPRLGWIYLTGASVFMYFLWYQPLIYPDLPLWLGGLIFVPTVVCFALEWWQRNRLARPGSPSDHLDRDNHADQDQQA